MKLSNEYLKIRCTYNQIEALIQYLQGVLKSEEFFSLYDYFTANLLRYSLSGLVHNLLKKLFNSWGNREKTFILNFNASQQITLLMIFTNAEIPAYLFFIHNEISKNFEL